MEMRVSDINGFEKRISLKAISHPSKEDHYCRVFYKDGEKLQNILVRQTLKQLITQLGQDDFILIHRSHMVNRQQIREYKQKGRNHWLQLELSDHLLPISRRRQRKVKKAVAG